MYRIPNSDIRTIIIRSVVIISAVFFQIPLIAAQDICSCTPLVYEWKLDFERLCEPTNVTIGRDEGITSVFCSLEAAPQFNSTKNLKPVEITSYTLIELNLDLTPLKSESVSNVTLTDGDLITFSSYTAADSSQFSGGFQVYLLGVNSALEAVILQWLVRYSNVCEKVPYSVEDSVGWLVFNGGTPARPGTCLFPSATPSKSPSQNPSNHPSPSMSTLPSSTQTSKPSLNPTIFTFNPSMHPSPPPTADLSSDPTAHPSNGPSLRRSRRPSVIPSIQPSRVTRTSESPSKEELPTQFPSEFSMSYSYSMDYQSGDLHLARWLDQYVTEFGQMIDLKKDKKDIGI